MKYDKQMIENNLFKVMECKLSHNSKENRLIFFRFSFQLFATIKFYTVIEAIALTS